MPILASGQGSDLPLLASLGDLGALGAEVNPVMGTALLAQASARFRSEARNDFLATRYERVLRAAQGHVRLIRVPVLAVHGVWTIRRNGTRGVPVVGWRFDGVDRVDTAVNEGLVFNAVDDHLGRPTRGPATVMVAWTAGFERVPEDVRWAVAAMASRAAQSPAPGVVNERIGDYSVGTGAYTASGALSMTKDEMLVAHRYRPRRSTMSVEAV